MNIDVCNKCLIIDLTHGGVKIATEISKTQNFKEVYVFDIYNTLSDSDSDLLNSYNIKILDNLKNLKGNILIASPIHLPLTNEEIKKEIGNKNNNYFFINHHEAVKLILKENPDVKIIEVTGVKAKTSSVFMLNEIFKKQNTLILSSLGAYLFKNMKKISLKKNISITPANVLEAINLSEKINNPPCSLEESDESNYKIAIFENSLGTCGIGDVGLLTNIVENYKIANNKKDAKTAKSQVFNCKKVVIEEETLSKFYSEEAIKYSNKINTFSLDSSNLKANLVLKNVEYGLEESKIKVKYNNDLIQINTFALGHHHVQNILGVITTALTLDVSKNDIIEGLSNFKGIEGRSSIKYLGNNHIIEEINPGINVEAIKLSIAMIDNVNDYYIVIGGRYGITCEEINEYELAYYLDSLKNYNIILTDELGKGVLDKMNNKLKFISNYEDIQNIAIHDNKNLLFIYRSNYNDLTKR